MKLRHSARTDVGKTRDHNEDDFGFGEGAQVEAVGSLFVVCDGMGGHAAGEVASRLGVETIISTYYESTADDRVEALRLAFERANARIHSEGRGSMGTTGVAALLHHDALHIANVGDSRAYLVRDGTIRQISRDHSLVGDQLAAGLITAEQARSIHYRNVITRALGYQPQVTVDLFRWPLQVGDLVVLSSDGLHGLLSDDEIAAIALAEPPATAVEQLVDLANERGGTDNITVLIVRVDALDWSAEEGDADHESETVELPAVPAPPPEPEPAAPPQEPQAPAAPAPRLERRLTLLGGLLATLLLTVLVFVILISYGRASERPSGPLGVTATPGSPSATVAATPSPRPPTPSRPPATPSPPPPSPTLTLTPRPLP